MIYHVLTKSSWEKALIQGFYEAPSLVVEGFIHLSKHEQVPGVLKRYYQGQTDLVLLNIDEKKLIAPLKFEFSPSVKEDFPHLYGSLNLDAVVSVSAVVNYL